MGALSIPEGRCAPWCLNRRRRQIHTPCKVRADVSDLRWALLAAPPSTAPRSLCAPGRRSG
eukprot:9499576-Pyramimonas_sp.AAC.1